MYFDFLDKYKQHNFSPGWVGREQGDLKLLKGKDLHFPQEDTQVLLQVLHFHKQVLGDIHTDLLH